MTEVLAIVGALLPATTFEGLTIAQWLTIAGALQSEAPEIKAALGKLHPAFAQIATDLAQGNTPNEAAANRIRNVPSEMSGVR